jgi:large conductance mechanosensitive channel
MAGVHSTHYILGYSNWFFAVFAQISGNRRGKEPFMGMLKEFREFAIKGNVIDMAVGIVIGTAFGKIVASLVENVIMPPIGYILGNVDFSSLVFTIRAAQVVKDAKGVETTIPAVVIGFGLFINTVINFLIVAFAMFLVIKQMNRLKGPPPAPTTKPCPHCCSTIPLKATRCPQCTSELTSN